MEEPDALMTNREISLCSLANGLTAEAGMEHCTISDTPPSTLQPMVYFML